MSQIIVVVDKIDDWRPYYPAETLMTANEYLIHFRQIESDPLNIDKIKVINLCRNYRYLGQGYYVSLIAEARRHKVIPSVQTINDLTQFNIYSITLKMEELHELIQKSCKLHGKDQKDQVFSLTFYFGFALQEEWRDLARQLFTIFPCPVLEVEFRFQKHWVLSSLKSKGLHELQEDEQDTFANSIDQFSHKVWRKTRAKKRYHYDLAILHNPEDPLPPSDRKALQNFIKAGKNNDVYVELITKKDYSRVAEFDALFIRETTAINNHTYRFAKKAQIENIPVIDDPVSILRCTNKIFLANILREHSIPAPHTLIISKEESNIFEELYQKMIYPMVIKIPDGSFSKGVHKISNEEELLDVTNKLFKKTSLLLVQEFLYTEFDWRIGILNRRPIFACKYYMSKGHWQIYNHAAQARKNRSGGYEAIPIGKVPRAILSCALKAANLLGDGLYGVDVKEVGGKPFIIEINDNPNIDSDVEDAMLGQELYELIIQEFIRRIEL